VSAMIMVGRVLNLNTSRERKGGESWKSCLRTLFATRVGYKDKHVCWEKQEGITIRIIERRKSEGIIGTRQRKGSQPKGELIWRGEWHETINTEGEFGRKRGQNRFERLGGDTRNA